MPKLDTDYGSVRALISGDKQYAVPKYQRPYSWTSVNVRDLFEDVVRLYRSAGPGDGDEDTHFLGAVVIGQGQPSKPMGKTQYVVIDGQQRMITTMLLLAAIRDTLVEDEDDKAELEAAYLVHRDLKGKLIGMRVVPSANDVDVLQSILVDRKDPGGKSAAARAYRQLKKLILAGADVVELDPDEDAVAGDSAEDPLDDEYSADLVEFKWDDLLSIVLDGLELVTISDVTAENAYQVFMTLNSKGLELAQVDLLRNGFFMLVPEEGERIHDEVWVPMEKLLGDDLEQFFHTDLLRRGKNIPLGRVYRTAMQMFQKKGEDVETALRDYLGTAQTYAALLLKHGDDSQFGQTRLSSPAKKVLGRLHEWRAGPAHPLLLEAAMRVADEAISMTEFTSVCEVVEALLVRRFICGVPPNDLRSMFAIVMQHISRSDEPFVSLVNRELVAPARRFRTDEELKEACRDDAFYRDNKQRQMFYILKRLAEDIEGRECPQIKRGKTKDTYSIEHVLPQTITPAWQEHLKEHGDETLKAWLEYRDTIGNLTLTAYNSELGQMTFEEKSDFIRDNLYLRLSKQILENEHWGVEQIISRSDQLAERACRIWARPGG